MADTVSLQFNRHGQPFVILDPSGRPSVMLPKEHIRWLIEQPEDVLADNVVVRERLALKYLVPQMDPTHIESMILTLKRELGRNLGNTQAALSSKLRECIDATMGLDDSCWRQVCLNQIMNTVVFKSTNSLLVGSPLCHNEKYLDSIGTFSTWLGVTAVIIGQYVPWFMTPLFGNLASVAVRVKRSRCVKFLLPVIKERMENIKRKRSDPSLVYDETKDLMTWTIMASPNASPIQIADMILFLVSILLQSHPKFNPSPKFPQGLNIYPSLYVENPNILSTAEHHSPFPLLTVPLPLQTLSAIHSTILTATNVFLDLLTSPSHLSYYHLLRAEASTAFPTPSSWLDSTSITRLTHTDSAIRESLRQNPTIARMAMRQVVPKNGITIPSGQHLPQGAWLGCSALGVQNDERFYTEPETYQPFRFSKAREEMAAAKGRDGVSGGGEKIEEKKLDGGMLVTTSETFLSFGHGRRAWFVVLTSSFFLLTDSPHPSPPPHPITAC